MISDSLTYNPNPLPNENISVFKKFIQSQDEALNLKQPYYYFEISGELKAGLKQKTFTNDSALCTSIFSKTGKNPVDFQPHLRENKNTDWIFFTFLICLVFSTLVIFIKNKRISQVFKAFLVPYFTNQLIRDGDIIREFFIYPILLVYFASSSILISSALIHLIHYDIILYQSFWIFIALILFFVFKIILINLIGMIFQTAKETYEYLTNYIIFLMVLGFSLFPFVFFQEYATPVISNLFLYVVMVIFVIISIYRIIRGFLIGLKSERYNLYYLFLYLCTVEILPFMVSVKLLINFYLTGHFLT
jgi:hypothetical protein